jgi:hypothetical protein
MLPSLALLAAAFFLQTPDATVPPANAHLQLTAQGRGVQIYNCTADGATFHWVFVAPEATLFDPATNQPVGKHFAGPTWQWNDGSKIAGKLLKSTPAADPANIPWLLLETHSTGTSTGALANITLVRRSNTRAGTAPSTGCDAEHQNTTVRAPYEATYTFYTTN